MLLKKKNFESINKKKKKKNYDSCFQLKSRFDVDARAPSIPLLNLPFTLLLMLQKLYFLLKGMKYRL